MNKFKNVVVKLQPLTRRRFIQSAGALAAIGSTAFPAARAASEDAPRVDENGPMAKALNYVHNAETVDAARRPSNRYCYNCALYAGDKGDEWADCSIFPGKKVAGKGWCSAWAPNPTDS